MKQIIQSFKVSFSDREIDKFLVYAKEILQKGALIPGEFNAKLEKLFANFVENKYAVAVNTGTAALEIIFRIFDLKDHEVLVPTNTNYATAEAVIRAGGKVILYDSDLFPDFDSIQKRVTEKTKALVIVHIGGYISPAIEHIVNFCKERNILLIEDASHAHGSRIKGKSAGTFGVASAFSMFATKILTTSEGGIIVSNDSKVRDLGLVYRDQGKDTEGIRNIVFGSAWRMSELHAALGVVQMHSAAKYIQRNHEIAQTYKKNLDTTKLNIPFDKNVSYSGYKFVVLLRTKKDRESLKSFLIENKIKPGKGIYDIPIHLQPALSFLNNGLYPKSESFAAKHLCLPIWKGMTEEEVDRVISVVNKWQEIG